MSACPLDEPHLAALRWACEQHASDPVIAARMTEAARGICPFTDSLDERNRALLALSSPSPAAQLVRDLLGACELQTCNGVDCQHDCSADVGVYADGTHVRVDGAGFERRIDNVPALILALLDALALPEGRAEAALKALREVGR